MVFKGNRLRLAAVTLVVLLIIVSGICALIYRDAIEKRDTLYEIEYELMDAMGLGLVIMGNNILLALDDSTSLEAAFNQSWRVYSGAQIVHLSVEALIAEYGASSRESVVFEGISYASNIVCNAFREWIGDPHRENITSGESYLPSQTVRDVFTDVVASLDVIRLQAWTYESFDRPYSRVALMDLELVDESISEIAAEIEGLGSPP